MKTWVHRIEKDGGFQFLTNAEFAKRFHSGEYKSKSDGWLPFKVDIPDAWEPMELEDGTVTLNDCPESPSDRVKLMDILVADGTGRPCLVLKRHGEQDELKPLDEVLY